MSFKVCTIDPGTGGGFAWLEQGMFGDELHTAKMPETLIEIRNLIQRIPADLFVLESVTIRPKDMEDNRIYRIVNTMIRNLYYLEAVLILEGKKHGKMSVARWQGQYRKQTKGMERDDRKRWYAEKARELYSQTKVTLWNADAIMMLDRAYKEYSGDSDWWKEINQ